jgi:hypothetical protein
MRIGWSRQPVVHPLALASGRDDAGSSQVGKVPGNLGLGRADDLREIADTDFLIGYQIKQAQASWVA